MAGPSPSPSGSSRRLSELLDEQQEPFSLHLYLLEKGCSPTTLDAAGGCGVALPCWPRSRGTSPAPRRVTASKKTPASGLLSKLLHGTAAPASTKRKKKLRSAAIGPCSVEGEKAASKRKNAVEAHTAEAADDEGESYEDDDSSKQLSPVSVLERRAFEKPPRAYAVAEKAIVVFRELLDAARRPALLQRKVATESSKSGDVPTETSTTTTTPAPPPAPAPTRTDRATSIAHLDEMFEANGHDLVPLDMPGERGDALLGRWDVGAELAVAVLEALTEEVVTELMGMVHHEDANAIDVKQCWLLPNC
ncbi:nucleolin-like [Triticum urartu]|nr:nucleolin-like [Triticum urartu]